VFGVPPLNARQKETHQASLPINDRQKSAKSISSKSRSILAEYNSATKLESFGFVLTMQEIDSQLNQMETKKEQQAIPKFQQMFKDWETLICKLPRKIENVVLQGVPNSLRQTFYEMLLDSKLLKELNTRASPGSFVEQAQAEDIVKFNQIRGEMTKIFTTDFVSSHQVYFEKLCTILFAYSLCDIDLVFHPQMVPYAGFMLNFMDEKAAYWCFRNLMLSEKHVLRSLFVPQSNRVDLIMELWDIFFEKGYKKIYLYFQKINIKSNQYCQQWFMTAFQSYQFPAQVQALIFDRFVGFGTRALLSVGLSIVSKLKKFLLQESKAQTILQALIHPDKQGQITTDWRSMVKKINEKWIPEKDYANILKTTKKKFPFF
jgi:hypothetical protein